MLLSAWVFSACTALEEPGPLSSPERDLLDQADRKLALADAGGALVLYESVLARAGDPDGDELALRARLGRADCRLWQGKNAAGRMEAEMVLGALRAADELPGAYAKDLEARAERVLGDAELDRGRADLALPRFTRAFDLTEDAFERDLLRYRRYLCARAEGQPDAERQKAGIADPRRAEFARLAARFPPPAPRAPLALAPLAPVKRAWDGQGGPDVLGRERWRASRIKDNRDLMSRIHRLTLHHSGDRFDPTDLESTAAHIRSIQRHHQQGNGWADIAYHFLVDRSGRVWEGRSLQFQGAHAGNNVLNQGNIGVCVLGDYSAQNLNAPQKQALRELLGWLQDRYRIPASGFLTHKEIREKAHFGSTACPGSQLTVLLDEFRSGTRRGAVTASH